MSIRAGTAFGLRAAVALLAALACVDVAFRALFPAFPRLADNFSSAYLARQARALAGTEPIVVLGDSVLWGYRIPAAASAVSQLRRADSRWVNLSYEGGSPANIYAVLRVLQHAGVKPRAVVFNVNLKEFNASDSAYNRLYPSVAQLASPLLTQGERGKLQDPPAPNADARLNADMESLWALYAMRSDVRFAIFGQDDLARAAQETLERWDGTAARRDAAHRPAAEDFEGTYDLSALDEANTSVFFLRRTALALHDAGIAAFAILTPTNHRLLHEYIDVPEYGAELRFVSGLLAAYGVKVLDYDRAFAPAEFLDNDHLTVAGNARLARLLARDVAR